MSVTVDTDVIAGVCTTIAATATDRRQLWRREHDGRHGQDAPPRDECLQPQQLHVALSELSQQRPHDTRLLDVAAVGGAAVGDGRELPRDLRGQRIDLVRRRHTTHDTVDTINTINRHVMRQRAQRFDV